MPTIRIVNIYKDTHQPDYGWFQGCFLCSAITARTYDFESNKNIDNTRFIVYVCPHCSKLKENSAELERQYNLYVNRYIDKHFTVL